MEETSSNKAEELIEGTEELSPTESRKVSIIIVNLCIVGLVAYTMLMDSGDDLHWTTDVLPPDFQPWTGGINTVLQGEGQPYSGPQGGEGPPYAGPQDGVPQGFFQPGSGPREQGTQGPYPQPGQVPPSSSPDPGPQGLQGPPQPTQDAPRPQGPQPITQAQENSINQLLTAGTYTGTLPGHNWHIRCRGHCPFISRRTEIVDPETYVLITHNNGSLSIQTQHSIPRYGASFPAWGHWTYEAKRQWTDLVARMPDGSAISSACLMHEVKGSRSWGHTFTYGDPQEEQSGCPGGLEFPKLSEWCEYAPLFTPHPPWMIDVSGCQYTYAHSIPFADIKNNTNNIHEHITVEDVGRDGVRLVGTLVVNHVRAKDILQMDLGFSTVAIEYGFA
eukprot:PhF_6_TR20647/c0_g1_i1/m.29742